jgi:hypothetical protein
MEDFPIWLKGIIWLIIGSTVLYSLIQIFYHSLT